MIMNDELEWKKKTVEILAYFKTLFKNIFVGAEDRNNRHGSWSKL
jgi:hypothetical protein